MVPPDPPPGFIDALLIRADGEQFRVHVPDPPASTFTLHRHGEPDRVFDLMGFRQLPQTDTNAPVYVERDERLDRERDQ